MGLKSNLTAGALGIFAFVGGQEMQKSIIEEKAGDMFVEKESTDPHADALEIHRRVAQKIKKYGGNPLLLPAGNFEVTEDGKAYCGGFAAAVCYEAATMGYEVEIETVLGNYGVPHLRGVIKKDGGVFIVDDQGVETVREPDAVVANNRVNNFQASFRNASRAVMLDNPNK